MLCEECDRLTNSYEVAHEAYKLALGGMSGLHGFDLQFRDANERLEKALRAYESCGAALREHQQHHQSAAEV
jgi:hypothetical protein